MLVQRWENKMRYFGRLFRVLCQHNYEHMEYTWIQDAFHSNPKHLPSMSRHVFLICIQFLSSMYFQEWMTSWTTSIPMSVALELKAAASCTRGHDIDYWKFLPLPLICPTCWLPNNLQFANYCTDRPNDDHDIWCFKTTCVSSHNFSSPPSPINAGFVNQLMKLNAWDFFGISGLVTMFCIYIHILVHPDWAAWTYWLVMTFHRWGSDCSDQVQYVSWKVRARSWAWPTKL